jgi:hypothetical protein
MATRKVSETRLRKLWKELKNVTSVARRIGYTHCGAYRAIRRLGYKVK